jgi:OOP family OmpA-OmpF porin
MKIIKLALCAGILFPLALAAQKKEEKGLNNFNTWSIEVNAGMNNAITPFGDGYSASSESKLFGSPSINHFDLGVRYMVTSKFGLKLDIASDKVTNASGSSSLPFETQQYRLGLQGVINAGRLMGFDEFTKTIGLLIHAGIQGSTLTPKTGVNKDLSEKNGGIMFGITPQVKLTNSLALTVDFTVLSNARQHYAWDGSTSAQSNNLNGQMYNTSVGLTYFFGKKETHVDWITPVNSDEKVAEITKRINAVEELMNDTDRDGIVDHLDSQNNTPTGVAVDSKGRFFDANNNGTPDELEANKGVAQTVENGNGNNSSNSTFNGDALKSLVENGSVNIYFNVNEDVPNSGSTNSMFQIFQYLNKYPASNITLSGFADVRGNEKENIDLSKRRAENVRKLLIESGINSDRIIISPKGVDKNYPASKPGLDLARRVSVQLNK